MTKVMKRTTEKTYQKDENRTYFCSELIAKAFKLAGVIKNDQVPSAKFFPVNFSEEGQSFLKLTAGTVIHRERIINLNNESQTIPETKDDGCDSSDSDQFFAQA